MAVFMASVDFWNSVAEINSQINTAGYLFLGLDFTFICGCSKSLVFITGEGQQNDK